MNAHSALIFFIVSISLATGAALLFTSIGQQFTPPAESPPARVVLLSAILENSSAPVLRFQVTSDVPLALDDVLIQISTSSAQANLVYREGILERNVTSGFFTE